MAIGDAPFDVSAPPTVKPRGRARRGYGGVWYAGTVVACLLVLAPLIAIVWIALNPTENIWPHLASTMLPRFIENTLILMVGVGAGTIFGGVSTAWMVTMCHFPGRRIFEWALLLPLAMPGYLVAYVYTDLLEFAGPVQSGLRALFGWQLKTDYWFPEIRTQGGAIIVLSLVLYPYVYMMARSAFIHQSVCVLEAGRVLGRTPWRCFWTVALPMARPALVIGASLAMMETLNDFGTVDYFGVHTLTAGIYEVWLLMGNAGGAAQIALVMLVFVIGLLWVERTSRRRQRYDQTSSRIQSLPGYRLAGWKLLFALIVCMTPLALGFLLPAGVLAYYALGNLGEQLNGDFLGYAANSLTLSGIAAVLAVGVGLFLAYATRLRGTKRLNFLARLASVGYAVPGAVLAVGVIIPFAAFDNVVDRFMEARFGIDTGLLLSGTAFAIVFAYVVRFLAVGFGGVDAALTKVTPNMDDASRSLGQGPFGTLRRVHLPMIRSGVLAGVILVFVDCMKELPATLILRPFDFDTLATFVYQYASDELIEDAALGALSIVLAGILPVVILSKAIRQSRPGHRDG